MSKIFAGLIIFLLVISVASIAQARNNNSRGYQPVTLCHHTHSNTNPYVEITVDNQGQLNGHTHHQGDIIPAPAGGCPGKTTPTPTPTLTEIPHGHGGGKPQVLGTTAPQISRLPQTGADSLLYWLWSKINNN